MNKNTILAAKRISDKYRNIRRKRKRVKNPEPIVDDKKRQKTSSSMSTKSARTAAKKISKKYRKLCYG